MSTHTPSTRPLRYLALAGPTASGKTDAALALARLSRERGGRPIEIINVDSALVYRQMDIGTAKPTAAERAVAPHHLIDILDPSERYSAADFVRDAERLIDEIHARGAFPLLVGGTMLYFKALFDGLDALPPANAAIRAAIDAEARAQGWPALHAQLAEVDPVTAARLAPADAQRIQRALEVWRVSSQPLSSFHSGRFDALPRASGAVDTPDAANAPVDHLLFSLEPDDRAWLHERVARRFDQMLALGFLEEVRALRARGDLHLDLPSMRCVGYRQAWDMLEAQGDDARPPTTAALRTLRDQGLAATRQLAKRQITWLRAMPTRRVITCDRADAVSSWLAEAWPWIEQASAQSPRRVT